jgi:pimeloyl-ACP methyl ester carboxylesterase
MPHLRVNGARLYYERHGPADAEPLLLITGFTISAAIFEPVLDRYAGTLQCILYDNRASGRSESPLRPTSMPELAADAAGLLEGLGLPSAHVYGVSMGGMVAQELAIAFPERVRGLVLGCTTPGGPLAARPSSAQLRALGTAMADSGRGPARAWLAGALFSDAFRREHPDEVLRLLRSFAAHRPGARGMTSHLWATIYHDTMARLWRIQAPTLVMHGTHDALAPPANARLLAERIPDAELAMVEGAGHAYALEAPERSSQLFLDWLRRRGPIAPGRPREDFAARVEPLTRALGLPLGAMRTGRSLAELAARRLS